MPLIPSPPDAVPANDADGAGAARSASHVAAPLWRVLAVSGHGLWAWLGLALLLGYQQGRNDTLLPLAVGLILAGFGLLLACLPGRAPRDWYGWRPRRDSRPTRAALLAFVTCLPMLGVAVWAGWARTRGGDPPTPAPAPRTPPRSPTPRG